MTGQGAPMVGKILAGRYEVLDRIGQGGMALVYRGRDLALNRMVAIKVLRRQLADDPRVVEHFQLEARAAASLEGPHVVQVYDVGAEEDAHYIVMELVNGQNLKDYLASKGPLQPTEALHIAVQIADALAQAHARHIVHRDIKPQNILITPEGTVKVTDFGIARAMAGGTLVNTGSLVGTAQYLSPEQARGKPVGPATDLYGLGVVLYEMLAGAPPFAGDSAIAVALRHVQEPVPDIRAVRPDVPPAVARLVARLLEKDPADRFPSAEAFRDQALAVLKGNRGPLDETVGPDPSDDRRRAGGESPRRPAATAAARRRWPWVVAAVVLLALLAGGTLVASRWLAPPTLQPVPRVVGMPLQEARRRLRGAGFIPVLQGDVPSARIPKGRVTAESPNAGVRLRPGAMIGLLVSAGPIRIPVPSFVGAGEASALSELAGLRLHGRVHVVNSTAPEGQVVNQNPPPNAMVPQGSVVTLDVSNGKGANVANQQVPNLTGLGTSQAVAALNQVGMSLGTLNYVFSTLPANTVIDQSPAPYAKAVPNEAVAVTVSKGVSPASQGQPETQYTLTYTVPQFVTPNSLLKVTVVDSAGNEEVYYQQVTPGQPVTIGVTWYGTSATVTTYLNGQQQGAPETLTPSGPAAGGTSPGSGGSPGGGSNG
jgi:beta-lactam-binding protein with PASTA domain/tRNA A-37 threonylcarbamoyl transferase component Bud32